MFSILLTLKPLGHKFSHVFLSLGTKVFMNQIPLNKTAEDLPDVEYLVNILATVMPGPSYWPLFGHY